MKLQNYVAFGLVVGLVMSAMTACGEGPTAPTSPATPDPVVVVTPPPTVVVTPVAEPFCPYQAPANVRATRNGTRVQLTFDPFLGDKGEFLRRYQIHVLRYGVGNTFGFSHGVEAEITKLSGPHNRTATVEWFEPLGDPGPQQVTLRAWFPNECHDDGHGNQRLNGEWSKPVSIEN